MDAIQNYEEYNKAMYLVYDLEQQLNDLDEEDLDYYGLASELQFDIDYWRSEILKYESAPPEGYRPY